MASLNGTGQVTLLNESKASYTGITLYKDSLYISDHKRRSVNSTVSATVITCTQRPTGWSSRIIVGVLLAVFSRGLVHSNNGGAKHAGVENTGAYGKPSKQKSLRYSECLLEQSGLRWSLNDAHEQRLLLLLLQLVISYMQIHYDIKCCWLTGTSSGLIWRVKRCHCCRQACFHRQQISSTLTPPEVMLLLLICSIRYVHV